MVNNFDEKDLQKAQAMASSPAGKELLQLLQNMDPDSLQKMMLQASSGDFSQISALLGSDKFKDLLGQTGEK